MANWSDIIEEAKREAGSYDNIRRRYIKRLSDITKRNVIVYYSGWLQKPHIPHFLGINDNDKNGFMACINRLDAARGLDLLLHTPGGDMAATESIVDYLLKKFGRNIRAIIPQLAMSGGTLIALACKEILMGKPSSIGPIDPQVYGGIPAHGVIEEYNEAVREIAASPSSIPIWQAVFSRYHPAMIGECRNALKWAEELALRWLQEGMFCDREEPVECAKKVVQELASHSVTLSHSRHYSIDAAKRMGLNIVEIEDDQKLQDAVLSVHHACILTLSATPAVKLIENQIKTTYIIQAQE